ncbi:hypothetical protein KAX03_01515 [Candidatus Bathyarchaeota archaeon]|nr:hypothetical protein [Candidatus Bathyarchaeota archaeon]
MVEVKVPHIPIPLDKTEELRIYKKPRFFSYTPILFGLFAGFIIWFLFTVSRALLIGLILWVVIVAFIWFFFWRKSGYWFTTQKIVIHDGSKILIIPYEEIAVSSMAFGKHDILFSTIYGKEHALKGVTNAMDMVNMIIKTRKEAS